jgi:uncharacterized membrane protein
MVLVGLIVSVFLLFEARCYRYFNVSRARTRLLETDFYAPMIRGEGIRLEAGWTQCRESGVGAHPRQCHRNGYHKRILAEHLPGKVADAALERPDEVIE